MGKKGNYWTQLKTGRQGEEEEHCRLICLFPRQAPKNTNTGKIQLDTVVSLV